MALVATPDLNDVMASLAKDSGVGWFEANNQARQPAAKEDLGADPHRGSVSVAATGATAKEDGGADPFCTHVAAGGSDDCITQWADYTINLRWAQKRTQGQGVTVAALDTAVERVPASTSSRRGGTGSTASAQEPRSRRRSSRVRRHC